MIVTEGQRRQMAKILCAHIEGHMERGTLHDLPAPLLSIAKSFKDGSGLSEELRDVLDAYVLGFEDLICRGMTKGKMGLDNFMERIRAGDGEIAVQYIKFFRKPIDTDPDFEIIRQKMAADPDLMSKISKAFKTPGPGYPHYMGALALLASLCRDELESGRMPLGEFEGLAKRTRAVDKKYSRDNEWDLDTGALRKFLNESMGIKLRGGKPGRPKK